MSLIFPESNAAWMRLVQQILIQHHTDIQRLWKRMTEIPEPSPGLCDCPMLGVDGDDEVGTYGEGSAASLPGSDFGKSGGTPATGGTVGSQGSGTPSSQVTGGTRTHGNTGGTTYTGGTSTGGTTTAGTTNTGGTTTAGTTNTGGTTTQGTGVTGWQTLGSAGTIRTNCCSNATIPSTLTATFTNSAGCPCLDGASTTLTWNGKKWFGSFTPGTCGHVYELSLTCVAGTTFQLTIHYPDSCSTDLTPQAGATCSPFSATFASGAAGTNCGCTGGAMGASFTVAVTA